MIVGQSLLLKRRAAPASDGDPYYSYVTLLVAPLASDNAVVDRSAAARSVTVNGNAALSMAVADPWGGGRKVVALDGAGDFLSCADHVDWDFASGPATLELWVYFTSLSAGSIHMLIDQADSGGLNKSFTLFVYQGNLNFDTTLDGASTLRTSRPHGLTTGTWNHLAIVLDGTTATLYRNGTALGGGSAATHARPVHNSSAALKIGARSATEFGTAGYIGAVRVCKGVARPTSAFMYAAAPPTY
jgi:hypothetical protein